MGKKSNNEGSIYKDKQGRWRGVVTVYTSNGKQKKKYYYGKTKKEVSDKVSSTLAEIRSHTYLEPSSMTLSEWLQIWLDTYCKNNVRSSTFVNYETFLHKHITPMIGSIKLCDLNAITLQQFYNDRLKNGNLRAKGGLKPKTMRNLHNMLHKALGQACRMEMIAKNPTDFVSIPRPEKQERRFLTVEEQKQLQEYLDDSVISTAILLVLYTGMRQGELLGLMWKDVHIADETGCYLRVTQSLNRNRNYGKKCDTETLLEIGYPKTPHSIRNIPLLPEIAEKLRIFHEKQTEFFRLRGITPNGFVFLNSAGHWLDPRDFQRGFKLVLKKAGIREINVHGIRHTFATRALESGMSVKTLSKILGHANVGFTLDTYAHVTDDLMTDEIAHLQEFL